MDTILNTEKKGMHPIRLNVRRDLKKKKLEINDEIKNFLKKSYHSGFIRMILQASNPPQLRKKFKKWHYDSEYYSGESEKIDILGFLRKYYKKTGVKKLWQKYRPYYQKEIEKYKKSGWEKKIKKFLESLRIKRLPLKRITLIPNLLNTNWTACSVLLKKESFLVIGPRLDRGNKSFISLLKHEILHSIINPLLEQKETAKQLKKSGKFFFAIKEKIKKEHYLDWNTAIAEHLIRAIVLTDGFSKSDKSEIEQEIRYNKKIGLVYIDYFFQKMLVFKERNEKLDEYIPKIIKEFCRYLTK